MTGAESGVVADQPKPREDGSYAQPMWPGRWWVHRAGEMREGRPIEQGHLVYRKDDGWGCDCGFSGLVYVGPSDRWYSIPPIPGLDTPAAADPDVVTLPRKAVKELAEANKRLEAEVEQLRSEATDYGRASKCPVGRQPDLWAFREVHRDLDDVNAPACPGNARFRIEALAAERDKAVGDRRVLEGRVDELNREVEKLGAERAKLIAHNAETIRSRDYFKGLNANQAKTISEQDAEIERLHETLGERDTETVPAKDEAKAPPAYVEVQGWSKALSRIEQLEAQVRELFEQIGHGREIDEIRRRSIMNLTQDVRALKQVTGVETRSEAV